MFEYILYIKDTEGYRMSTSLTKEQAARQIWLLYFNRALLERGVITEKQYNQMKVKIQSQPGNH